MRRHCSTIISTLLLLLAVSYPAFASHIIGGEMTYKFLNSVAGGNNYRVTLTIYEDCLHGSPEAINRDNPAYFVVYDEDSTRIYFDSAQYATSIKIPPNYDIACITNPPAMCVQTKTFNITFMLPRNHKKYTVAYQRCCRNGDVINILNADYTGATYFCEIPSDLTVPTNTSAVFNNFPPEIICVNTPLFYNNSATDVDGDSLSYMLCDSYDAPNGLDDNAIPDPPPYKSVAYKHPPYSYYNPLTGSPPLAIDPVSGIITATPLRMGRYLVTVCCSEWRNGVLINTIHREFQFVVTDCSKAVVADMPYFTNDPAIYKINCTNHNIDFVNTSKGGNTWLWDFGVAGIFTDTSSVFQPTYTYPDTGIYTVKLVANPGTPCADSIQKKVKVFPLFYTAFDDTGKHCPGTELSFIDQTVSTTGNINTWNWNFGDGDTALRQNPTHTYVNGGTYNVTLVAGNQKNCIDTTVHQVVVEIFKPNAGNDTIIVKGETVVLNATGGVEYEWTPPIYLSKFSLGNAEGYFPDTGVYHYTVKVKSAYGCIGIDSMNVWVVDQAAFFVPTGFSPNGDGLNDIFRPIAIGYRSINFFRVFNRYGEQVYFGQNIKEGWDGTYNHKQADIGTYYWHIGYIDRYGKEGNMRGDVTLVK